jgi:bis(5'-nucleosyl)-tetraphosphatase (symmetrical)
MATYAIGDVQGCLQPLLRLLDKIKFDATSDQLLFTGDLINRGKESLATLRFIKNDLPPNTICVLGNHDLSLLTSACGFISPSPYTQDILHAEDKFVLLDWLRCRPLLYTDSKNHFTITHAGIFPEWDLQSATTYAREAEAALCAPTYETLLKHLFGNEPRRWQDSLTGWDRIRFIVNAFTRMRFCTPDGELELSAKGRIEQHPELVPWFAVQNRQTQNEKLLFGHWAALNNEAPFPNIYPIDSGCVWGNCLTAFCLESEQRFTVACDEYVKSP